MKPTVYLDSTVPSYHLPQGADPIVHARHLLTRRWWDADLSRFDVFVSQIVLDELAAGDAGRASIRLKLVEEFAILEVDEEVERVARFYVDNFAMPRRDLRDAFHLALPSVHEIEYLVTWNFAHLANAGKRRHIDVLNRRLHLISPVICTPEELMLEPEV
ncbi:MAG: type II toxin-antitoxin system VapC family toxin [Phycisphaerales bacterium]|nr:type II toxin-antitoxin system VapC family toxin [Phycisphaerales bacterium]